MAQAQSTSQPTYMLHLVQNTEFHHEFILGPGGFFEKFFFFFFLPGPPRRSILSNGYIHSSAIFSNKRKNNHRLFASRGTQSYSRWIYFPFDPALLSQNLGSSTNYFKGSYRADYF